MKRALTLLKDAGMRKINFAGGEPFLYPAKLGQMVDYCKETLRLESVPIVTNGSQSDGASVNIAIGRGSGTQVTKLYEIRDLCRAYGIKFKLNTVVCHLNFNEDMNRFIEKLQPFRWKCFQVLVVPGENDSERRLRDAHRFLIRDKEFSHFCDVHRGQRAFVPESNALVRNGREPSPSILEVGVQRALESVYWDEKSFISRSGMYDWSRDQKSCSDTHRDLDW
ncbi:hypothetical protein BO82DRAFT_386203 [Aspergillus uvarum CBS 121591]|uniref:Radical SAM core domain-containing protein n=1 Tax=Aspergillus uvarum CBS 121591 TaxID=1448315 RepID=A0A319C2F0_9EURO|nr:hypothetical protein BO82DRAFT_386203 [Aspergillus uvarum CBS 121591]PYH77969.1 hypothetical protein BO82DRAFT_386203 [Aspergillus uvarum CBS 121591]